MNSNLKRRDFLRQAVTGIAAAPFLSPNLSSAMAKKPSDKNKRPNILFLFADDWGRYAGIYRDSTRATVSDIIKTPNVDRVAGEGVIFNNAFVPAPQCTPTRGSIVTGMNFYRCGSNAILMGGCWDEHPDPMESLPSFVNILRDKSYHTGNNTKTGPYGKIGGDDTFYHGAGVEYNKFSQVVSEADDKTAAKNRLLEEVRKNFRLFLNDRKPNQPFFYWFGPTNCHTPWAHGSGEDLWGIDPDSFKGKLPKFLPDVEAVRADFSDYFGEVQAWDAMVGVMMEELEKTEDINNTLVVLAGDNGIPGIPRGKCNLYDLGVQVPLIMRWPSVIKKGRVVDDFVSLMDLAPTFLETAGINPPENMQAKSLMNIIRSNENGQIDKSRNHVIVGRERHAPVARADKLPYPSRAIRTKDYLYIRNFKPERWPVCESYLLADIINDLDESQTHTFFLEHMNDLEIKPYLELNFGKRPAEELYDLSKDVDQMNNVALKPEYSAVKQQLSKKLLKILEQTKDPRLQNDAFDYPPYVVESDIRFMKHIPYTTIDANGQTIQH
jgi:uncharacterized sulfatase